MTVKKGGKIVSIAGTPNGRFAKEMGLGLIKKTILSLVSSKITGLEKKYDIKYTFLFMKHSGQQLEILSELLEAGTVKPTIDRVFPFEEAKHALAYTETGKAKGKGLSRKSYCERFESLPSYYWRTINLSEHRRAALYISKMENKMFLHF